MDRLILIFCILLLTGCGSSKSSLKNDVQLKAEQSIEKKDFSCVKEVKQADKVVEIISTKHNDKVTETTIVKKEFTDDGKVKTETITTTKETDKSKADKMKIQKIVVHQINNLMQFLLSKRITA